MTRRGLFELFVPSTLFRTDLARIAYRSVRADERGKQMKRLFIAMTLVVLQWQLPPIAQTGKAMTVAELAAYNKPDREKVLYEGAKKEGKLMWYTSLTGGPNTDAPKVFEAKYSGVAMEVYRGDSDALISRITQEAQAKRYIVDTGARVIAAMLTSKGSEFVQKLKSQQISLHSVSGRAILDMVISGELGVSPTVFLSHSRVSISKGAPIKWVPMDLVPTNAGGVAIPANAPHPHAALLFGDFLLSPDGQKFLSKYGLDSAVNKPDFKRFYAEAGMTAEKYEKENEKWEKLLREMGRK